MKIRGFIALVLALWVGLAAVASAEPIGDAAEHVSRYNAFITVCGMNGYLTNESDFSRAEDGSNVVLSATVTEGSTFDVYYNNEDALVGYQFSVEAGSYGSENFAPLSILFVGSIDITQGSAEAEETLTNLTATATEIDEMPGALACVYSTKYHEYTLIALDGGYVLTMKPL